MARDTCGERRGLLVCDRPPHDDGDHRGYDEEHDAVLFWPTVERRLEALERQIAQFLEEADLDPSRRQMAVLRLKLAMRRGALSCG